MKDKVKFASLLEAWGSQWRHAFHVIQVEAYWQVVVNYEDDLVVETMTKLLRTCRFMPLPVELSDVLRSEVTARRPRLPAPKVVPARKEQIEECIRKYFEKTGQKRRK